MKRAVLILLAVLAVSIGTYAQSPAAPVMALHATAMPPQTGTGTLPPASPHGVKLTWTAASQGTDTNPIAGYNVYRCTGTCTAGGTGWSTPINSALVTGTIYQDPASGLSVSTTYSYVVETVDSVNNSSGPSNVATVAIPSSFPFDPDAVSATPAASVF